MSPKPAILPHRPFGGSDQLVFLHLPKTAGTSFTHVLQRHFAPQDTCPAYLNDELAQLTPEAIGSYRLVRGHFFYDALAYLHLSDFSTVTYLRDPVERVLSTYTHLQEHPDPQHHPWGAGKTLGEFLDHPLARAHVTNLQTRRLAARLRIDAWSHMEAAVASETEEVLAGRWPRAREAMRILEEMTFFGLAERFDESMALLAYTFAWRPLADSPRLNVAPQRQTRQNVPANLIERILELNQEDQTLYDYARQLFNARYAALVPTLLDEHYQRHSPIFASPRAAWHVSFGGPLPNARGWYDPESPGAEEGGWRWLGPELVATLDLALAGGRDLRVRCCVAHVIAPDVLESLRLDVNDHPVALARKSDGRAGLILDGTIPAAAIGAFPGASRLTFRISRTVAPSSQDPTSGDGRRLGVALRWLAVEPADA